MKCMPALLLTVLPKELENRLLAQYKEQKFKVNLSHG